MAEMGDRQQARHVFEETLTKMMAQYVPDENALLAAQVGDVPVAYYRVSTDGRWECHQVLDELLWPSLSTNR